MESSYRKKHSEHRKKAKCNPEGDFHPTSLLVCGKQTLMFGNNLPKSKIHEKKTDLFVRAVIRVHVIQNATENEIGPDNKDYGGQEEKGEWYDANEVHGLSRVYDTRPGKRRNRKGRFEYEPFRNRDLEEAACGRRSAE